jgi:protein gp37
MAQGSGIEWTESTWNPVTGCTKISPGCKHCYAERMAERLQAMGQANYVNGFDLTLQPHMLELPLGWKKPQTIFVNSMSDLFHKDVPLAYIRRVFDADEPAEAERRLREVVTRYKKAAPQLAAWLEENVPEALTVLRIPAAHRRRLRTTNGLERLNKEIKRRTRVATLFPNEPSLLRLASAVLSEISDDWETERAYLNMETR